MLQRSVVRVHAHGDLEVGDATSLAFEQLKTNHSDHHCSHEDQCLRLTRSHRYQGRAWAKTG
jgi:hypothetical protein